MTLWFNWRSDPVPSVGEADVIATILLNQLMVFHGGKISIGGWSLDNKL